MENRVTKCGIVILAAGNSSRLGSPKQLLPYKNTTLLRYTVQVALEVNCGPVMVITGANSAAITDALKGFVIEIVENTGWEEGMSSSLRTGLQVMVEKHPETDGIIFMVCDQPYITKSILLCLIETQQITGKAVVASVYHEQTGAPALFHRSFFEKLFELKGDRGARRLIASHPDDVAGVPFEAGAIDIDTKEDYEQFLK